MLFLWVFGGNVEDRLGHVGFLALYFLVGFAAAFTQVLMSFDSIAPLIGASGAIAGVLGGYLVLFPRARVLTVVIVILFPLFVELPAVFLLLMCLPLSSCRALPHWKPGMRFMAEQSYFFSFRT